MSPAPRIDGLPLKGITGLIITAAFVVIILVFVPPARLFLLISIPLGLIVAAILYLWHKHRPVRVDDNKRPLGL